MIKLELPGKPAELTDEKEAELVAEFKATGKSVWRASYITTPLLAMTHSKCAYSEQRLNEKSAYMEVDHFKYKNLYPDEVVRWGNLLPSCKKCNTTKGETDVCREPIINPLYDDPKEYLYVKAFRLYPKNPKGGNTIEAVALNDADHFVNPRARFGFIIDDNLESNWENLKAAGTDIKKRNAVNRIKNTLRNCCSENEFSAVLSTHILCELPVYKEIELYLKSNGMWDDDLEEIKSNLVFCSLPPPGFL